MSTFTESIKSNLEGLENIFPGLASSCPDCLRAFGFTKKQAEELEESRGWDDEGVFSWSPCESCGSSLGGTRYSAHAFDKGGRLYHLEICCDCLLYHANGDEPENWEG